MVPSSAGAVIMVPFPFSDLSQTKLRSAVVLAAVGRGDWVLCHQITSNPYTDSRAIRLADPDFSTGSLQVISYARPGKLFTANDRLITSEVGTLTPAAFAGVREAVTALFQPPSPQSST